MSLLFPFLLIRNIRDFKLSGLPKVVWDYKSWLEPHLCTDIKYMSFATSLQDIFSGEESMFTVYALFRRGVAATEASRV